MRVLRGLRLNCLLVPLVQTVLGASALIWLAWHLDQRSVERQTAELRGRLRLAAALLSDPARLHRAYPGWSHLAVITYRGEGAVSAEAVAGSAPRFDPAEPPPELIEGFTAPIAWTAGDRLAAASPLPDEDGRHRLLYGEVVPAASPIDGRFWFVLGAYLVLGSALAVYLGRHVYLPVRHVAAVARATAEGRPPPPAGPVSPETEELRTTVEMLSQRARRQAAERDGATAPSPGPDR